MKAGVSRYTQIERILHDLAFSSWFPRVPVSQIESVLFKDQLAAVSVEGPVFITALPRAGTTLLLELCVDTREFASHRYRDMPFLLTPLLWNRYSKNFRKSGTKTERVHGDGILVNADSPDAFEEIIWKEFWPSYYKKEKILSWTKASFPVFEEFFRDHMRKIILLRGSEDKKTRYVSKNNLNIARVGYLASTFPDATILILFRSPLQHAASLLKQHRNFIRIHEEDNFAQKYMHDTGHFDFGKNFRPINFNGWLSRDITSDSNTISFWLQYWINAYGYLINDTHDQVRFYSYDSLCDDPQNGLERLGRILDVEDAGPLMKNVDRITTPRPHPVDTGAITSNMLDRAQKIYLALQKTVSPN
ncbi:MAG: sulfotransferase [Anaerolineales bacterium]